MNSDALQSGIADLFGRTAAVAVEDLEEFSGDLWPQEWTFVRHACDRRRAEFTAGRVAARRAMAMIGLPAVPILAAPDRAPIWPEGVRGSISHGAGYCAAVVARDRDARALGLDIEAAAPLKQVLWPEVLSAREIATLQGLPKQARGFCAKLIFSAKECAYKAQYAITGAWLDFDAMEVDLNMVGAEFTCILTRDVVDFPAGYRLPGRFSILGRLIVTAVKINEINQLEGNSSAMN